MANEIARGAEQTGQTPEAYLADLVQRQLAVARFERRRARLSAYGPRAGLNSDDDAFAAIS